MAKPRCKLALLRLRIKSAPNHEATAAPDAVTRTTRQSIRSDLVTLFIVPESPATTTTAKEVATAVFWVIPSAKTKAGTMMIPPPTPHSAPTSPAANPTKTPVIKSFVMPNTMK